MRALDQLQTQAATVQQWTFSLRQQPEQPGSTPPDPGVYQCVAFNLPKTNLDFTLTYYHAFDCISGTKTQLTFDTTLIFGGVVNPASVSWTSDWVNVPNYGDSFPRKFSMSCTTPFPGFSFVQFGESAKLADGSVVSSGSSDRARSTYTASPFFLSQPSSTTPGPCPPGGSGVPPLAISYSAMSP